MYNDLLDYFEKELDKEAERLKNIIINKYDCHDEKLLLLSDIIKEHVQSKYLPYYIFLEFKVPKLLPDNYKKEIGLIFVGEGVDKKHLEKYAKGKKECRDIDIEKIAEYVFENIIKNNNNSDIFTIAGNIKKDLKLEYFDSKDAQVTIYYIDKEIEKNNYKIDSYNPLIVNKK